MLEPERSANSDVTETTFLIWLKKNHITADRHDHPNVSYVELMDPSGNTVSSGSGKGKHHPLGGLAEAIEHYYTIVDSPQVERVKGKQVRCQKILAKCGIVQELKHYDDDEITVTNYYNWMDHSKICKVPHVLINPWFIRDLDLLSPAEKYLARYSTNSGTALGLTTEDSILHGLSEEIERHYLSHFYLKEAGLESNFTFQELKLSKRFLA